MIFDVSEILVLCLICTSRMDTSKWQTMTPIEQLLYLKPGQEYPTCITIVFSLARNVDYQWLSRGIVPRILSHPRFRSHVQVLPGHQFRYKLIPDFTPESQHIHEHIDFEQAIDSELPFEERHAQFTQRLNQILSSQFVDGRPLWKIHVFPNFSTARRDNSTRQDCSTIIIRVHHCIADGIGLLKFFIARIIDDGAPGLSHLVADSKENKGADDEKTRTKYTKFPQSKRPETTSAGVLARRSSPWWTTILYESFVDVLRSSLWVLFRDSENMFNRPPIQKDKVCAIMPSTLFSVDQMKQAARRLGVTLNDIFFAAVSGGTAAYFREKREDPKRLSQVRCAVPINRHMFDDFVDDDMCNQITIVAVPLHLKEPDLRSRLQACASTMTRVKRGVQPVTALTMFQLLAALPISIRTLIWKKACECTSMLMTNVPGPTNNVTVAGASIDDIHFFAPNDGKCGVTVSLLSYGGAIRLGVLADRARVNDPERYIGLIRQELESVLQIAG